MDVLNEARIEENEYINQHVYTTQANDVENNALIDPTTVPCLNNNLTSANSSQHYIPQQTSTLKPSPVFFDPNTGQHYLLVTGKNV